MATGHSELASMPGEIVLSIADNLLIERDLSNFACTNRSLNSTLSLYLYKHNVKHHDGDALWWAIRHGEKAIAEKALDAGADIKATPKRNDRKTKNSDDPLFHLAITTRPRNIRYLREELYRQYVQRHLLLLQLLIERGMDLEDLGGSCSSGCTALQLAASYGYNEVVQFLIDHGANINAKSRIGATALYYAVDGGCNADIVKLLIEKGLDVNDFSGKYDSPLNKAASTANEPVARVLLEHGALVNQVGHHKCTPLMRAAGVIGSASTMELLIKHGANVDGTHNPETDHSNTDGNESVFDRRDNPLSLAIMAQNADGVRLLLEHGANVNIADSDGKTSLHYVLAHRNFDQKLDLAKRIIAKGADINAKNRFSSTPLHTAAAMGDVEAVKLLIKHGVDVNVQDQMGYSPLHFASSARGVQIDLATVLLKAGADVNLNTGRGRLPLVETRWQSQRDNEWVKEMLAKYGHKEDKVSTGST